MVLTFQAMTTFYQLKYFMNMIAMAWFIVCVLYLLSDNHKFKNIILLCAACLIVVIVHSRPSTLLLAAGFSVPLIYPYITANGTRTALLTLTKYAIPPLIIGAALTMLFNYIRFDSVFEFGVNYQISMFDTKLQGRVISYSIFSDFIYHTFIEPFELNKTFPFFHLQQAQYADFGFYHYLNSRRGLNAFPAIYFVLAACFLLKDFNFKKISLSLLGWITCTVTIAVLITIFAVYTKIGMYILYNTEFNWILMLFGFMAIFAILPRKFASPASIAFLGLFIFICLKTIAISVLLPFDFDVLRDANPDFYLTIQYAFQPFHY